ncbi:MAG: M28 family peptidase [Planctomycetes bacterium]|nr:M28 family peptidase [Planctomycetota bacterium]
MPNPLKKRVLKILAIGLLTLVLGIGALIGSAVGYLKLPTLGGLPVTTTLTADPNRLQMHVLRLAQDYSPRDYLHVENLDRSAEYIKELFLQAGGRVVEQVYVARERKYRNVIATFGPEAGALIVVGAHYDAYREWPGADDNASGVAGLLELARLLGLAHLDHPVQLAAFSTEEPPFYDTDRMGSAVHAQSLRARGIEIKGMICLEMIGYYSDVQHYPDEILKWLYPEKGNFIAVIGRWEDRKLIRWLKRGFKREGGLPVQSVTMPIENSDHLNYWRQGYRAVMVTDTAWARNPNYHTARDRPETLDYQRMAGVVEGVLLALVNAGRL